MQKRENNRDTGKFKYFAFISYNHEDKKAAKTLQNKLQKFSLPIKIQQEKDYPKYVSPIFRDDTDTKAGDLPPHLKKGLSESKYLIVICSPSSANSKWVQQEIEYFISLGRGKNILPFIIEGVPNANNCEIDKECFPKPLKTGNPFGLEPLAADITKRL